MPPKDNFSRHIITSDPFSEQGGSQILMYSIIFFKIIIKLLARTYDISTFLFTLLWCKLALINFKGGLRTWNLNRSWSIACFSKWLILSSVPDCLISNIMIAIMIVVLLLLCVFLITSHVNKNSYGCTESLEEIIILQIFKFQTKRRTPGETIFDELIMCSQDFNWVVLTSSDIVVHGTFLSDSWFKNHPGPKKLFCLLCCGSNNFCCKRCNLQMRVNLSITANNWYRNCAYFGVQFKSSHFWPER